MLAWLAANCPLANAISACCTRYLMMNSCTVEDSVKPQPPYFRATGRQQEGIQAVLCKHKLAHSYLGARVVLVHAAHHLQQRERQRCRSVGALEQLDDAGRQAALQVRWWW